MQITDAQRKKLCEMMYYAFLEIRILGWAGKSEQAADLADAFHNVPRGMWEKSFVLEQFRDDFLAVYHEKYPEKRGRDYVKMVHKILRMRRGGYSEN